MMIPTRKSTKPKSTFPQIGNSEYRVGILISLCLQNGQSLADSGIIAPQQHLFFILFSPLHLVFIEMFPPLSKVEVLLTWLCFLFLAMPLSWLWPFCIPKSEPKTTPTPKTQSCRHRLFRLEILFWHSDVRQRPSAVREDNVVDYLATEDAPPTPTLSLSAVIWFIIHRSTAFHAFHSRHSVFSFQLYHITGLK